MTTTNGTRARPWVLPLAVTGLMAVLAGCAQGATDAVVPDQPVGDLTDTSVTASEVPGAAAPDAATSPTGTPSTAPSSVPSASPTKSATGAASKQPTATKGSGSTSGKTDGEKKKATTAPKATTPSPSYVINPRLTVSKSSGIDQGGAVVRVTGAGFDMTKGIYVAFCVQPEPGQAPGPCGGGVDTDGNSAASEWISSNPPSYGKNLARPYGPGGTFTVSVLVSPKIGSVDCRVQRCVIATRADHTRGSDRSQDVLIPITFAGVR